MAIFQTKPNRFGKLRLPKQNTSSLDRSGRELGREPFIPAVRVLCKLRLIFFRINGPIICYHH